MDTTRLDDRGCDVERSVLRTFHRAPHEHLNRPDPPVRAAIEDEPLRATPPAWNAIVTGMVGGVVVASLSGYWHFALFSVVTGAVTGVSWLVRLLRQRRKRRIWRERVEEIEQVFAEECRRHAHQLARLRRKAHPSMIEIRDAVLSGGEMFWQRRALEQVSIGYGSRAITVVDGAPVVALDDIPVLVDVSPGTVVGVHGRAATKAVAAMITRLAAQVGPSDWSLVVIRDTTSTWDVLRSLPHHVADDGHTASNGTAPPTSHDQLFDIFDARHPAVAIICDSSLLVRHSPVLRAVERGAATAIVMAQDRMSLPAVCSVIVDADDDETDGISLDALRNMCTAIAMWADPDCVRTGLPTGVELHQLVAARKITAVDIAGMWRTRRGLGPRAVVGLGMDGIVDVDLDREGPHIAIIGTTGSGKSEFLRQLVVSMALNGAPSDVSFVLIDYKGGSAFDACADLPHVVGVVTDLDSGMADRVLFGLRAELHRRESVLRAARVSDVRDFHSRPSEAGGERCNSGLSRLVVMIDEVAALREEVPEFVPALAAIAQRGRSLGIHLIVASQRSNALSADVLANASIRIALRVQSATDSQDIIGSDRAVFIDRQRPGRLIMNVAGGSGVDVQAAHVSAELTETVAVISDICALENFERPHRPWSDPLPEFISRSSKSTEGVVGIADEVRQQTQIPVTFTWDHHLLIVGGVGRTNALRSVIESLGAMRVETDIVVITCRSKDGRDLGDIGYVVEVSDREKVARALKLCEQRALSRQPDDQSDRNRRIALVVDDLDVWRSTAMSDRVDSALWERFEHIVETAPTDRVVCIATSGREQGLSSVVQARMGEVWRGGRRPGVFRVEGKTSADGLEVQMFWEPSRRDVVRVPGSDIESVLRCLPDNLEAPHDTQGFGVFADTWTEISWGDLVRSGSSRAGHASSSSSPCDEPVCFLVIGPSGSGVSCALGSIAKSWSATHPDGLVMDVSEWETYEAALSQGADYRNGQDTPHPACSVAQVLVVIEDVHRVFAGQSGAGLGRSFSDVRRYGHVSIVAGVTPSFVRTQHDHWIQHLRRSRTGVLLGRSSVEDCDLFGIHAPPLNVYRTAPGRGLWVDGGRGIDIVQFYAPPSR